MQYAVRFGSCPPRVLTLLGNLVSPSATGRPGTRSVRSGRSDRDNFAYIRGCALRQIDYVRRSRSVSPMVRRVLRLVNRARLAFCGRVTMSYVRSNAFADSGPQVVGNADITAKHLVSCYGISGEITSFRCKAPARVLSRKFKSEACLNLRGRRSATLSVSRDARCAFTRNAYLAVH